MASPRRLLEATSILGKSGGDGWTPPHPVARQLQPWHSPEPLKAVLSPSRHPPPAGRLNGRSRQAAGRWGPGTGPPPARLPWARRLAPLLARCRRQREFCPFRRSFSASLRRRARGFSKAACGGGAGPARQTYSAGSGGQDTAEDAWVLVLEAWASRDTARASLGLGGRARSSRLHCPGQEWSGQGAQTSLRHCQQGKPSGVTGPETIRILPEAGPGSSLQPGRAEQLVHPGTDLAWQQQWRGRCPPQWRRMAFWACQGVQRCI